MTGATDIACLTPKPNMKPATEMMQLPHQPRGTSNTQASTQLAIPNPEEEAPHSALTKVML
jgi:hypothetical protein